MHTMAEPLMMYDVVSPVISVQNNGHVIAVAGVDGNIRLIDGKLRSNKIIATIEAHTGSISDMHLQANGTGAGDMRNLITCGLSKRVINPYDTNSPFQYTVDTQARLFDLRTQRALHLRTPPSLAPQIAAGGIQYVEKVILFVSKPIFLTIVPCKILPLSNYSVSKNKHTYFVTPVTLFLPFFLSRLYLSGTCASSSPTPSSTCRITRTSTAHHRCCCAPTRGWCRSQSVTSWAVRVSSPRRFSTGL